MSYARAFGEDWTSRGLHPATPPPGDDPLTEREAWEDWYHVMVGRPKTDRGE